MKKLFLILLLALIVGTVAAQDGESTLGDVDPSGVTVTYWHQFNSGAQFDTMNAFIAEFNETNEYGIIVEGLPQGGYSEIRDLMNAAITSGELPNLVAGYQSDIASYYADGAVVDLLPYATDPKWGYGEEELNDLNPGLFEINVWEGEEGNMLLGWPQLVSANVLAVNTSMLSELGIENVPATMEEFVNVACAAATSDLTGAEDAEVMGYPIKADASNFESMVAGFGGNIFDYENNQYNFTSPEALAALTMYAELYAEDCAYLPTERFGNTDDFARGWNPMALGSSAGVPFIISGMETAGVDAEWTITTTPSLDGSQPPALNIFLPSLIMVPSTPEEQLATWLFIKFLTEPENQATWTQATNYLPTRLSVAVDLANVMDQESAVYPFTVKMGELLSNPDLVVYSTPKLLSYNGVRDLIATAMTDVTTNGVPVEEAAQTLQDEANALLEELDGE